MAVDGGGEAAPRAQLQQLLLPSQAGAHSVSFEELVAQLFGEGAASPGLLPPLPAAALSRAPAAGGLHAPAPPALAAPSQAMVAAAAAATTAVELGQLQGGGGGAGACPAPVHHPPASAAGWDAEWTALAPAPAGGHPASEPSSLTLALELMRSHNLGRQEHTPQDRLQRLSIKLFGCTPEVLPPDLKQARASVCACVHVCMCGGGSEPSRAHSPPPPVHRSWSCCSAVLRWRVTCGRGACT